ncbi:MAG: glycosyltransferase [Acidobacteriota bacterium]
MRCPLAVFVPGLGARSETFIRRHATELLPGRTVVLAGRLADGAAKHWDATGPLIDLDGVSDPRTVSGWLREYGVTVLLGEYLDASLPWLGLARELGIPFFAHAHGYDVSLRLREPYYRIEYLRYRRCAGVITMSEASRNRLIALGLAPERTHCIPYGVDVPERFVQRPPRASLRLLAVGRMVAKKGPILMLDAVRQVQRSGVRIRFDLVGTGPLDAGARQFVATHALEQIVTLHGACDHTRVKELMTGADIFVQHSVTDPETGDEEGLPVAILEAMSSGLPVVATRHAGIPEAVDDGMTGFLVDEGDTAAMAERIGSLLRDRDLRLSMGHMGWNVARTRFTWATERSKLLGLLGLSTATMDQ